ncbi:MAG: nucleoside kinase [Breznakibacter sp.]
MTPKNIRIKCLNNNTIKEYPKATTLDDIAKDQQIKLKAPILGALVNNKLTELSFEVYHPKNVQFIDVTHPEGMRMYIRSLQFILYKAVSELHPGATLNIEHSVSKGIYCELHGTRGELSVMDVLAIGERMREIVADDIPLKKHQDETEEVLKIFGQQGLHDKLDVISHRGKVYTSYYTLNGLAAYFYGFLAPSTSSINVFDLNKYYNGMLLQLPKQGNPNEVEEMVIQNKMFEIFREHAAWNRILNVRNVGDLNKAANNGKSETLIKVAEALHEKKIAQIADQIAARRGKVRIVLISGPSSSGKTTFGKRLAIQLLVAGLKPLNLSLDNYFVNRVDTPKDENGEYDFEALEALDIELFNQQLIALLGGKSVEIPKFSFEKGERVYDGEVLQMDNENILIIEGIHGLNPQLTHLIPNEAKFKVYVSALTSVNMDNHNRIPTTDNRLIRRIVRDYKYRHYSARDTISRWQSVRRGEDRHIFPFQEEADAMFNSALNYELAVFKPFAEPILREVQPNQPEYAEATRLLKFFNYLKPILPREIPPTSIVREFLGGSSFSY